MNFESKAVICKESIHVLPLFLQIYSDGFGTYRTYHNTNGVYLSLGNMCGYCNCNIGVRCSIDHPYFTLKGRLERTADGEYEYEYEYDVSLTTSKPRSGHHQSQ